MFDPPDGSGGRIYQLGGSQPYDGNNGRLQRPELPTIARCSAGVSVPDRRREGWKGLAIGRSIASSTASTSSIEKAEAAWKCDVGGNSVNDPQFFRPGTLVPV